MTTFLCLTAALIPFALIAFGVSLTIQRTEDDELVQHLDATMLVTDREALLREWLAGLSEAPTEPALEVPQS